MGRRFGKSLLLSTMKAYFEGRKELFKGLALERLEQEWKKHPVLHLDLNTGAYDTLDNLERILNNIFLEWEERYGSSEEGATLEIRFKNSIRNAYNKTGQKVVILADEYDKPLLEAINDEELMELKVDAPADKALKQIDDKGYMLPFAKDNRKQWKIGIFFSSEKRTIIEWKCVEVS